MRGLYTRRKISEKQVRNENFENKTIVLIFDIETIGIQTCGLHYLTDKNTVKADG